MQMEVEEGLSSGSGSSSYVCNGINATNIWFVYSEDDFSNLEKVYKPTLCHQVYNSDESIFGYHCICVNIYYNGRTMDCYLDVNYSGKIKENRDLGIKADDVMRMLKPWLPEGYCTDKETFINRMRSQRYKMFGTIKEAFQLEVPKRGTTEFSITHISTDEPDFKELHDRFQRIIVWYIDAASVIDLNDPRWTFFYVYETFNDSVYPVGFCTVYQFYKYPNGTRPRISQFFILPLRQRMGLGTRLLETVYKTFREDPKVFDITVEDPSREFRAMRDLLDCKLLKDLNDFSESAVLEKPFPKIAATSAGAAFKIYFEQARRVYDILNLYYAGRDPKLLQEWCRRVKKRLDTPAEKEQVALRRKKCTAASSTSHSGDFSHSSETDSSKRTFKQYLEEILPIVHKLQNLYGREVVKVASEVKRIWEKTTYPA